MSDIYEVIGAAVVLRLSGGGERYLYRGARFNGAACVEDSLTHLRDVGLVRLVDAATGEKPDSAPESDGAAEPGEASTAGKKTAGRSTR